jgi:hypothetical protein
MLPANLWDRMKVKIVTSRFYYWQGGFEEYR